MHFTGPLFVVLSFATVGLRDVTAVIHPTAECNVNPVDFHFLLDVSGSIKIGNFSIMMDFVKNFVDAFDVGPDKALFGISTYSKAVYPQFSLNTYSDKAAILQAIDAIGYPEGGTYTNLGLDYVRQTAFTAANGDRPGVMNVLIVITDGESTEPALTIEAAKLVHKTNIVVLAVGVGVGYNKAEVAAIATDPSREFHVESWDVLQYIQAKLQTKACEVCPFWSGTDAVMIEGKCVRVFNTNLKWQQAQDACAAEGPKANLLEISSDVILQYAQEQVKASGVRTWLGASDQDQEGQWKWIASGNTLDVNSPWWGNNQPDNYGGNENCLIMRQDEKLNDYACNIALPYFCEALEVKRP